VARQAKFGGGHTLQKLEAIEDYLRAYTKVMKKQKFVTVFFDAFAGTGELAARSEPPGLFDVEAEEQGLIEGSARRALRIDPGFDRYVFVERMKGKAAELDSLRHEFESFASRIDVVHGDANDAVMRFCATTDWRKTRAVMFLDPFGNQVSFETLRSIAGCPIDLWYLFPAGIGVNRQIGNDGTVVPSAEPSLHRLFGTDDWREQFVRTESQPDLFGESDVSIKHSSADAATRFMIGRMKTIFGGHVTDRWLPLGRAGAHWYSLIFACGNPNQRAWEIANRIANAILTRK
jgi:three-Cys-motif partner protein